MTKNPACTPEPSATSTATTTAVKTQNQDSELNAVCVDVIDLGIQETPWGKHPRISFVFESDAKDQYGSPKWLTRTYNNYAYPKSALTTEIRNWLGCDISGDDADWDLKKSVGEQATLSTAETVSKKGNTYDKIVAVHPGTGGCVQPSGLYERKEMKW